MNDPTEMDVAFDDALKWAAKRLEEMVEAHEIGDTIEGHLRVQALATYFALVCKVPLEILHAGCEQLYLRALSKRAGEHANPAPTPQRRRSRSAKPS